jgi:hypothetical protein
LARDKASTNYNSDPFDVRTVKTLINGIADGTLLDLTMGGSPYSHCTVITVDWDSEDSLIDSFMPKSSFRISVGESRLNKIKQLLGYTKCVMRFEDDGHLHIFSPTVSGVVYDYEYKDDYAASSHPFFSKIYRNRLVLPNKYVVKNAASAADIETYYTGEATSAASYALLPKTEYVVLALASSAEGTTIAEAMIQRAEMDHERGSLFAPINVGAEVHDYVKVTDNVEGNSRVGNIGYLSETYEAGKFDFFFGFGDVMLASSIGLGGMSEQPYVTYKDFQNTANDIYNNLYAITNNKDGLLTMLTGIVENIFEELTTKKLTVTEQLTIPVREEGEP